MAFQKQGMGQGLSGRVGGMVYRGSGEDTIVAAAPTRVDPKTPGQEAARRRMSRTVDLWGRLPLDAMGRWRDYAAREGGARSSGYSVFRGLAARYLHLHGGGEAPTEPPTSPFLGDGIVVVASGSPSFRSGEREGSGDGESGEAARVVPPLPSGQGGSVPASPSPRGEAQGGVLFEASGPNSGDVVTELLLQRLPARHRLPKARDYRTAGFVAFAGEAVALPCEPGAYACGVRFVRASTGQATAMIPLGTVEVGG